MSEKQNILFRGARIIDPQAGLDETTDLEIIKGQIGRIGHIEKTTAEEIELRGKVVIPGLFDMHVHLREPGEEHKETIESGCAAAATGGFTGVACMPNTSPAIDNSGTVEFIIKRAAKLPVDVHPIAAITWGRKGKKLTDMYDLLQAGAVGFSDDGSPLVNTDLMRRALEYTSDFGSAIIQHAEDPYLFNGLMHEGIISTRLGLPGIPSLCEEIMVWRDIRLAEYTGGRLHICHISAKETVELIRQAKENGINVTAEVTPHHLFLAHKAVEGYDTNAKMNPPLRTEDDRIALVEGIRQGVIDCIATDHAPHSLEDKETDFSSAPFGVIGLETALGLVLTNLLHTGFIDWNTLIERMSITPRKILGLEEVNINQGNPANLTIIDPEIDWEVDPAKFLSQARNCPFKEWRLKGKAWGIYNKGNLVIN